ncbi:MAG: hypothetical protein M9893_08950 [Pyrinomonadaceae bacterium]|nr:hypothetical protein [Pyrinomonadaceae bacterium]
MLLPAPLILLTLPDLLLLPALPFALLLLPPLVLLTLPDLLLLLTLVLLTLPDLLLLPALPFAFFAVAIGLVDSAGSVAVAGSAVPLVLCLRH